MKPNYLQTLLFAIAMLIALFTRAGLAHAADADGRLFALCVGLKYPGTGNSLRFSTDDVRAVTEAFRNSSGYREDQRRVEVLIDDDSTTAKPDAGEVRKRLAALANAAEEEDRLLFFYSGHGILDQEGHSVLVCGSGDDLLDEAGHLALSEVKDIMARSRARDKLAIIDACHSGGKSATDGSLTPDSVAAAMGGPSEAKAADDPVAWLVSSSANEKSWEDEETGHGLFTRFFLEAVGESAELADIDYDGRLSVRELHDFVSQSMAAHILAKKRDRDAKWRGIRQTPQLGIGGVRDPDDRRLRRLHLFYYDADTVQSAAATAPAPAVPVQTASPQAFDENGNIEIPKDMPPAEAFKLIQQKADRGVPAAVLTLGTMYERGVGVPRDFAKAFDLYQRAANLGMAEGYYNVGVCHEIGMGTLVNSQRAFENFEKSAEFGLPQGYYKLATLYIRGVGVPKNEAWGIELLGRAATAGHAGAANDLGLIAFEGSYGQPKDPKKAFDWFSQAANLGNPEAMKNLAVFYRDGIGRPKDPSEELMWYALARLAGYPAPPLNAAMEKVKRGMTETQIDAVEKRARAWVEDFQRRVKARKNQ